MFFQNIHLPSMEHKMYFHACLKWRKSESFCVSKQSRLDGTKYKVELLAPRPLLPPQVWVVNDRCSRIGLSWDFRPCVLSVTPGNREWWVRSGPSWRTQPPTPKESAQVYCVLLRSLGPWYECDLWVCSCPGQGQAVFGACGVRKQWRTLEDDLSLGSSSHTVHQGPSDYPSLPCH